MHTIALPRQNMTLAYNDHGHGSPLILLHAFPLDHEMWEPQLAALVGAGYRVIVIDLPGFGASPRQPGWTIDSAADAVAELLEQLRVPTAVVGGVSMGGYVALAFARRHPRQLAGLILADTRAGADDEVARARRHEMITAIRQRGIDAISSTLLPQLLGETTRQRHPHLLDTVQAIASRQTPEALVDALIALRDRPDATPYLGNICVPTLVLVGEEDTITPPLYAAR
ncbi:MAG: alpha/beta hydrolase, partial [Gemmataceae bacterium]|nr:alpha/beta hydrolase [Gemmataceae bacterium]